MHWILVLSQIRVKVFVTKVHLGYQVYKPGHLLWHFVLLFLLFSDFAQKLASALSHNPASTLHTLNLSNNSLEDKG